MIGLSAWINSVNKRRWNSRRHLFHPTTWCATLTFGYGLLYHKSSKGMEHVWWGVIELNAAKDCISRGSAWGQRPLSPPHRSMEWFSVGDTSQSDMVKCRAATQSTCNHSSQHIIISISSSSICRQYTDSNTPALIRVSVCLSVRTMVAAMRCRVVLTSR